MRIIGGTHKGRVLKVPKGLPVRPTTDFAKEGLFNILQNRVEFDSISLIDLFSGTGHISLEFASRGTQDITSVDQNRKCLQFLEQMSREFSFNIRCVKADVFSFLKSGALPADIIFADPPYELSNIPEIHQLVFANDLLRDNGILIIEHGPRTDLSDLANFTEKRKYGNVNFSFFKK